MTSVLLASSRFVFKIDKIVLNVGNNHYFVLCEEFSPHGCWPLDSGTKFVLMKNYSKLAKLLYVDEDLVQEMLSQNCLTVNQLINIENTGDKCEKTKKLLNYWLKSSVATHERFVGCLQTTQRHLVPLVTKDTGKLVLEWRDVFILTVLVSISLNMNLGKLSFITVCVIMLTRL